jgi:hypothetical protein
MRRIRTACLNSGRPVYSYRDDDCHKPNVPTVDHSIPFTSVLLHLFVHFLCILCLVDLQLASWLEARSHPYVKSKQDTAWREVDS